MRMGTKLNRKSLRALEKSGPQVSFTVPVHVSHVNTPSSDTCQIQILATVQTFRLEFHTKRMCHPWRLRFMERPCESAEAG